ncbi:MAG: hypothetical protein HY800_00020 [Ignavibacteriales bacterium]|nr:hypothetical protein [Ignavibacteriales bacterium]
MENELLKEILDEIKGLRSDTNERLNQTNQRLDQTVRYINKTNERLDNLCTSVEQTNERLNTTIIRLDGLNASVIVLQGGLNDVRYELQGIKQIIGEKVIWQNDNIVLQTREGKAIYGVIKRTPKE